MAGSAPLRVLHVVGARPNFMKIAPIHREMAKFPLELKQILVHTGQHYDASMSDVFFRELGIPAPDVNLEVGSGTHAAQTAEVMTRLEPVLLERKPDWVLVVGDVNSTLAAALVCSKIGIRIAHVEAGLRSFDRTMPEEVNRVLTDQVSDLLFTTEENARANLVREGIAESKIRFVGNVMIDTLVDMLPKTEGRPVAAELGVGKGAPYVLVTLHRPSNVDDPAALRRILEALASVARDRVVLFPVHPRTRSRIESAGVPVGTIRLVPPLGYLDFLALEQHASLVVTDSGGVQEETAYLGVPCLTVRPNTERPVTLECGTNRLVGNSTKELSGALEAALRGPGPGAGYRRPKLWDGRAAERIVRELRPSP